MNSYIVPILIVFFSYYLTFTEIQNVRVLQGEFQSKQDFEKKDRTNTFFGKINLFYSK